jgi:hypothetical protein
MLIIFAAAISGAVQDNAAKFKQTQFYSGGKLFNDAVISPQGNLILEASVKFISMERGEKDKASIEAAVLWEKLSNNGGTSVMVEIREGGKRTSLWKSSGNGSASMIEQWGLETEPDTRRSIFMSGAVSGNSSTGSPALSMTFGSYFFRNLVDCAANLSVAGSNGSLGLSGRYHYQLDPKWDINGGIELGVSGGGGSATGDLAVLIGASEFLNYRSSLDFSISMGTTGVTIGSGITYYFDRAPQLNFEPIPVKTQVVSAAGAATAVYTPVQTPTTATIIAAQPADTPQSAITPRPFEQAVETPKPENTQQAAETPQSDYLQQAIEIPRPANTQQAAETPQPVNTQQPEDTPRPGFTPWIASPTVEPEHPTTEVPTATQASAQSEATPAPVNAGPENTPVEQPAQEHRDQPKVSATENETHEKEGTTAGVFMEADALNLYESINSDWLNCSLKIGCGNDSPVGLAIMPEFLQYTKTGPSYNLAGLDLAIDIYPFGRSPSGIYFGPIVGARYYLYDANEITTTDIEFCYGGEAGIRLLANFLALDAWVTFTSNKNTMTDFQKELLNDLTFRAGAGFMFYSSKDNGDNSGESTNPPANDNGTTAGFFLEADILSLVKKYEQDGSIDTSIRFGPGHDSFYATSFILEGSYLDTDIATNYSAGADIAFDFYPLGRSPSGLYIGPLAGAEYFMNKQLDIKDDYLVFTAGGEAGIRFLVNFLVLDANYAYTYNMYDYNNRPRGYRYEQIYRAGVGLMFYSSGEKN